MSRRPYLVAFSVVLLVALTVLNLPDRQAGHLKLASSSAFTPLFGLAGSLENVADRAAQSVVPRARLLQQIESLKRENDALRFDLVQSEAAQLENDRLRREVLWRNRVPWRLRLARVIGQDPANWWRSLWIDLGSRESLQVNTPVLTPNGLVGRVAEVAFTRSRVVLVGDPNCRFSAQVQQSRDKGIIAPDETSFDRQIVRFTFVPTTVTLQPGSSILTSGDGGVFPKGIHVGQIVDVATNGYGVYLEARVRLSANLNRLEEVWVLLP